VFSSMFNFFNFLNGYSFLVLLAMAVFICCELTFRHAKCTGLNTNIMVNGVLWIIGIGFMISHWVTLVVNHPERIIRNPLTLIYFSSGISLFGGFLGASIAGIIYFKIKKVPPSPNREALLFGAVPSLIVVRLGCTIAFDHPGTATDFFLGMVDRYGVMRHNVGFYEMLVMILLTAILYGTRKFRPFEGFHAVVAMFLYSPIRFFLDSLRISDKLYWGATMGQFFAVAMLIFGMVLFIRGIKQRLKKPFLEVLY
jgi:phosphatidylglycerol:prolipoprotein diacylglycerol transferase